MLFMLLPPDGTTIDFNLQRAQAREDHAHAPVYIDMVGSAASAPHQWTSMLATLIDCDITHMDMLCAQGCTRRTLQGEPWMDALNGLSDMHRCCCCCCIMPGPSISMCWIKATREQRQK